MRRGSWTGALAALAFVATAAPAHAFDPAVEAKNFSKTFERAAIYDTPSYQANLLRVGSREGLTAMAMQIGDPERNFVGDLCWNHFNACAGDIRLYDWQTRDYGIVQPVLFTARNGATLSGHVWATKAGPAKRPGIVITNGSVQADEQLYWYAAQTLAKAGYVVLTFDPQGQGQSDTLGEAPDTLEGVPAQTDGRPFYDGTEDALNFFFSSPEHPYVPVTSCTTGTSHAAKQRRRVGQGFDAAYNPFWELLDPSRVGIAGHSYGAGGVSYVGQADPRVKAIVAWDNLGSPTAGGNGQLGEQGCPADPSRRAPAPITKPALGLSADYGLPPLPNDSQPDPLAKSTWSRKYSEAHVDTGEIIIRGGSHLDFSFIPLAAFGASLRGEDLTAWYTTAWFDKYVKGDPGADARLLTTRWRDDAAEKAVDPDHDGNMFSFYYRSRLDIVRAGGVRFTCEDLRTGCDGMVDEDGWPGTYDAVRVATTPDGPATAAGVPARTTGLAATVCTSRRHITVHAKRVRGVRIRRVTAYRGSRRLARSHAGSRAVRIRLQGLPRGRARLRLVVTGRRHGHTVHVTQRRSVRTCGRA
jgi:dienelactone hydrolase